MEWSEERRYVEQVKASRRFYLCRSIQKLFPVENASTNEHQEHKEENASSEEQMTDVIQPVRAAAKDSRWKSQLKLDLRQV